MCHSKQFQKLAGCLLLLPLAVSFQVNAQNAYSYTSNKSKVNQHSQFYPGSQSLQEKQTLLAVLKELNRLKGVYFLFSEESMGNVLVKAAKDYENDTEKILNDILKDTGLKYKKISSNTFVIVSERSKSKEKQEIIGSNSFASTGLENTPVKQVPDPIRGRITSTEGQPLQGVSISIKGSNRGTTTGANGEFTIEATKGETLIVSYIGFAAKEFVVGDSQNVAITLSATDAQMSEVVVTALGIRKERKALGYSVTELKGSELTQARETNVANSLVGRIAGVNVSSVSGGPTSSTNVIIRGISSLVGNNQPLYVVNGIPVTNEVKGNDGGQYTNAPDLGDGISNINPDDIETISVLKGAAASALYGSRAKAGVILITTKSGSGKGTIEFNSNYVADQIVNVTDWQYLYGSGANGIKPATAAAAYDAGNSSWGAKLDGSNVIQFDGVLRPYVAQKDNLKNFYRSGNTFTNTLSFSRGFDGGAFRFSSSYLKNNSTIPNSGLDRYNFNFSGNFTVVKGLTIDARANFVSDKAKNRPILADGAGNANFQAMFLPTSVDINTLKPGTKADGSELSFTNNTFATNPWFASYNFINNTLRNRLIGSVSARYTFTNGLFAQLRIGRDLINDRYTTVVPTGTAYYNQAGRHLGEQYNRISELNTDFLIGKSFKISNDISISPTVGGNIMKYHAETTEESGTNFAVPYVYNILNVQNKSIGYTNVGKEVQSLYGTVEANFRNLLYLSASGRNDWFSTLAPSKDLGIFYPSVSGSFVFSELAKPSWMNFGKFRVGWANVGGDLAPYQTLLNYGLFSQQLNGMPLGNITNASVPNSALRPSNASEIELGTEMRLFNNRVGVDVAWYTKKSKNEILVAPASNTSGYTGAVLNIGELQNKGVEFLVSFQPLKSRGLNWTASINGSRNENKVISLAADQAELGIGTSRTAVGFTRHVVGLAANQIMAFDYKYDAGGKIELGPNGVPVRGELEAYGSAYHKWTAGFNNEFSYKALNFSFLIDGKFGGKVFSATDYYGYFFGLHKATLENREGTFGTNTTSQTYYTTLANNVSKMFVYDASFIKFRQFTLGYTFPASMFNNRIKGATLSIVGRNLFTLMKKTDNIDPEASYSGYTQGLELGGVPPIRSYGLNLNVKF
ncbi:MAG: rane protein [Flavisolibacter sp.]|nr:rane protein [Flavisolibacter sp.]